MQKEEKFTGLEGYGLLTITFLFHTFDKSLPRLASATGSAAWIAQIVGAALGVGLFYLYLLLFRRYSGKDILDIYNQVYGKVIGKAMQILLLAYLLNFTIINLHEIAGILRVYTYSNTSLLFLKVLILAAVAIVAVYSVKGLSKTVSICLPICLICLLIILIFSVRDYDPDNLKPVLGYGPASIGTTGFALLNNYDGILIISVFLSYFGSSREFHKRGLWALFTGIACFVGTTLCYNLAFPYGYNSRDMSGVLDLARGIYINRFFQRFESIFVAIMSAAILLVLCLSFLAVKKVYCSIFSIPRKSSSAVSVSLALLVLCLSVLLESSSRLEEAVREFNYLYGVYFVLGMLLLTLLVGYLRKSGPGRMPRQAALLLIPCLLAGFFSGCGSYREPDEEVYAIVMGVDRGKSQEYQITLKFLKDEESSSPGDKEDSGGEQIPDNVVAAEADSGLGAVELMNATVSRHITLDHLKMVVISEEIARENIRQILMPVLDRTEGKSNMAMVICAGKAKDYVSGSESSLGTSLPMEMEMVMQPKKGTSSYKVVSVAEVMRNMTSHQGDSVTIYAGVQPQLEKEQQGGGKEKQSGGKQREEGLLSIEKPPAGEEEGELPDPPDLPANEHLGAPGYLPKNIPISSSSSHEYAGMAVLKGERMVGVLDTRETAVYMMLDGSFHNATFSVEDPGNREKQVVFDAKTRMPTQVRTDVGEDGQARLHITAYITASVELVQNLDANYTTPEGKADLERHAASVIETQAKELVRKIQKEYEADILLLGKRMAGEFTTIPQWEDYNWESRYPEAEITVSVSFQITA